jgi:hypothetical protein
MSNTQPGREVITSSSRETLDDGGRVLNPVAPFAVQFGEALR